MSPQQTYLHTHPPLATTSEKCSRLTFLVLEPQLLLDLLAGEVDDAGELGAIEGLCDVVGAVVLDEGQQLLPAALLGQDLEDVGEAWTEEEHGEGVRLGRLVAGRGYGAGRSLWCGFGALSFTVASASGLHWSKRTQHPLSHSKNCSLWWTHKT